VSGKPLKVITMAEWQTFANTITNVIDQCDRLNARAKAQGRTTVPASELLEMHARLETAAASFIGEKRRFWESHESFLNRIARLCADPHGLLVVMHRNGIQLRA
jgi:hypothetical protein